MGHNTYDLFHEVQKLLTVKNEKKVNLANSRFSGKPPQTEQREQGKVKYTIEDLGYSP